MVIMNSLATSKRCEVVRCLTEGCSIRATGRMTGVSKNTIVKLLADLGRACSEYQDRTLKNLPCKRLQLHEIWSFVYAKAKNVPAEKVGEFGVGDVWTWTAIDAETKLIPSWMVGTRDGDAAKAFVADLAGRLASRVQITTDGHSAYLQAVENAFGWDVDYAMLQKIYGGAGGQAETRYSPGVCIGCEKRAIKGNPDPAHVSTSYAERANLSMRMHMRRFTRLTNAFSKKVENHAHAIALYFMWYNFGRIHQTLRCTPAMRAGVSDHVWSIEEIVGLLPELKYDTRPEKRKIN
jgi:IS1 family transposase